MTTEPVTKPAIEAELQRLSTASQRLHHHNVKGNCLCPWCLTHARMDVLLTLWRRA